MYSPDPYVTVQILGTPNGVKKTRHVPNTSDPEWNETLDEFYIDPKRDHLIEFVLYDLNRTVNEEIGREVFDFYGFSSDTDNNIVISFKNVSHTKGQLISEESFLVFCYWFNIIKGFIFWGDLTTFKSLGQKFVKDFVGFLKYLNAGNNHSEINWPLAKLLSLELVQDTVLTKTKSSASLSCVEDTFEG